MAKKEFLGLRVSGELKRGLQKIARAEERSTSQITELLLRIGVDAYQEEGSDYLQRKLRKHLSGKD